MTGETSRLPEFVEQGEQARLIPVASDTSKERRSTSALLAVFMAVEEFSKRMLRVIGAPSTKTARITCFTEVVFKQTSEAKKYRPDGLILVNIGSRTWTALIEAKVGAAELSQEQVEAYLDIAKENHINAVITISNQFATVPTHHPLNIAKYKTKSVKLYHWSWMSLLSEAILLSEHGEISDIDRSFLLNELIRYLQHENSGVVAFSQMGAGWKDVCGAAHQGIRLSKATPEVANAVASWHQLSRYLSLKLSLAIERKVSVHLTPTHARNPQQRFHDAIDELVNSHRLADEFVIPNAASKLKLIADLDRRTLTASMRVNAPKDKKFASAAVTWILRQLVKCDDHELIIRAIWSHRPDTFATLGALRENKGLLLHPNLKTIPTAFEVLRVRDLAGKCRGSRTFVEEVEVFLPAFYGDVGQHLKMWMPKAPKMVAPGTEKAGQVIERRTEEESGIEGPNSGLTDSEATGQSRVAD